MRYENVCLEAVAYTLPEEIITSDEIEARLAPLYQRLRLPEGRLELMTGIRERRLWPVGTVPSGPSIRSGRAALEMAEIDPEQIGVLIHGSVCRDHLEPATASRVHHELGLPSECIAYDVSNACLGMLNGVVQVANMIELGQIRAGLVVGTESSRALVETTIDALNRDTTLSREQIKLSVASLTIGSASAAVLLTHRDLSRTGNRLTTATIRSNTAHHQLCHSGQDEATSAGMSPLMTTDSERLMHEGIQVGSQTFAAFLAETGWSRESLHKTFCHQVGLAHRKLMLESLGLPQQMDFTTVQTLGNTGSTALPVTLALGIEAGHLNPGEHVGLFGIGSGIHCLMLGIDWQKSPVRRESSIARPHFKPAAVKA